ncbi:MAG: 6-bladed beta-propeller [Acidobacteria bacterium]|nr:6-bladed beta-propeller [Acidobacteriota bacterium]
MRISLGSGRARLARAAALSGLLLTLATCSDQASEPGSVGDWVGTIAIEGPTTTVVNESGSVWGAAGHLVEELSIGVEEGADEYMFGMVTTLTATDDRIFVIDVQVPVVREYDHDGQFIANLGRAGEGPGEYGEPAMIAAHEDRVFVGDATGRVEVFAAVGEALESWSSFPARCCGWPIYALDAVTLWAPVKQWLEDADRERRYGVQKVGSDGALGDTVWIPELDYEQTKFQLMEGVETTTPFSPWLVWNPTPSGGLVVGTSDRYRFEMHHVDGTTTVVERSWDPVSVPAEHREYERLKTIAGRRRLNQIPPQWDGAEMPDHKPAYRTLIPTASGEIWVLRIGPSERQADCVEDPSTAELRELFERPCWKDAMSADVFGSDGRYLGNVELPELPWADGSSLAIDGDRVVASVIDEQGIVKVKRYRLRIPGVGTD